MLKEEGYKVIFVNFNFVIIMIDLEMVDKVYIEFLMVEFVSLIICKECLDVLFLIFGG